MAGISVTRMRPAKRSSARDDERQQQAEQGSDGNGHNDEKDRGHNRPPERLVAKMMEKLSSPAKPWSSHSETGAGWH